MPRSYPPEFRRKVLDLLKAGRIVQQVAADLQISDQTIYNWRRQERIDAGLEPGITSSDQAELVSWPESVPTCPTGTHRRSVGRPGEGRGPRATPRSSPSMISNTGS
ncbi:transposase [Microbispora amethystogenes]|uniref:Transposase n=1 Tax=Microbispora amethystogenes TaxID=1427754 RepID=A0ABQ4FEL3_9ACTN|nr:transposase [Microbispora amethystogenes]GIH33246.1 hypothetical protein Mam01_34100 [Microbispora amethystogenes]